MYTVHMYVNFLYADLEYRWWPIIFAKMCSICSTTEHTAWRLYFPQSNVLDFRSDTGSGTQLNQNQALEKKKKIISKHNDTTQIYLLKNMCQ